MSPKKPDASAESLRAENEELRRRLEEAEDALRAIRDGEVDAVIVSGSKGDRVFSLAESENLHRLMVETMNEAGMATSLDGTILYCNQRACTLLQRSTSELLGRHLSEIVALQSLDRISLLLDNASRGTTNDRVMFLAADESPVPMQVWASRADTNEGPMISMVGTDLSLLEADHALLAHLEEQQNALQAREHELVAARDRLSADLDVMSSMQRMAARFVRGEDPDRIAGEALDAAMRVSGAFSGDVQLLDNDSHFIAVHRGFESWRVEFWAQHLKSETSACGSAWESGQQVLVESVDNDSIFAGTPALEAHHRAGVRAVLSTPMVGRTGSVMGVLTVHFDKKGSPEARVLRWIDLIARETGDIIDRASTETDLRRRREELETLFNESPAAILIAHDAECREISRNAEALRMFGEKIGPERADRRLLLRATSSARPYREDEMEVVRDDGAPVIVTGGAAPLFDAAGNVRGAVAVFNNITAHRHTKDELRRTLERRDQLVRALEDTQRTLKESHLDLEEKVKERTVLSEERGEKLRALADALTSAEQEERRRLAQILHDDLQQMLVAIRLRLANLESLVGGTSFIDTVHGISEVVDSAINSARSLTIELSPPVLRETLPDIIAWLGRRFEERHEVFVEVTAEAGVRDPSEEAKKFVFQAVRELIVNVGKHSGTDQARVHIFAAGDEVCIEVRDQGKGFDTRQLTSKDRATYGLFSIRDRVELMGGSFEMQSTEGQGTACIIRVPAVAAPPKSAPAVDGGRAGATEASTHAGPVRVLVVDDHTIFRRGLISILESYPDIKVVGEASDGEEGVQRAGDLLPDVVIMDLAMPRMNGIEATRLIKSRFISIDVIALSFQESEHARSTVLEAGARAYFTKSGPLDNLLRAIRERNGEGGTSRSTGNGNPAVLPPMRPQESTRGAHAHEKAGEARQSPPRTRKA